MEFFGIGLPELVLILVLTLIVVGPQRLPEVAAQLGRTIREFRRYSSGVSKELMDAVQDLEREYQELRGELRAVSGDVLQKAESLGRDLTGVSDEIRQSLKVEEAKGKASPEVTPPGDNGATADGTTTTPAVPATTDEAAE
jgi:sec-independent protein translocase protein TatA